MSCTNCETLVEKLKQLQLKNKKLEKRCATLKKMNIASNESIAVLTSTIEKMGKLRLLSDSSDVDEESMQASFTTPPNDVKPSSSFTNQTVSEDSNSASSTTPLKDIKPTTYFKDQTVSEDTNYNQPESNVLDNNGESVNIADANLSINDLENFALIWPYCRNKGSIGLENDQQLSVPREQENASSIRIIRDEFGVDHHIDFDKVRDFEDELRANLGNPMGILLAYRKYADTIKPLHQYINKTSQNLNSP